MSAPDPLLSVVIASVNGPELLERTLAALDALPERERLEILVVSRGEHDERLAARAPSVRIIEGEAGETIPALRYRGIVASSAGLVAILEDHVAVESTWADSMIEAHRGPWGAVAGAVANGRGGWVDWAAFLCEYTTYMPPVVDGEHHDLPGNNIAYKRECLLRHAHELRDGRWESWVNARLHAEGVPTAVTNGAVVHHLKPFGLARFLVQRFHFSRSYAGMRRVDQSPLRRVVYGFGSAVLPALLSWRTARQALAKRVSPARLISVAPLLGLFFTVGAFGEMLGYLIGPGRSLSRVE
ncbi:MAG: glycosyltransferase [Isosphaeraceae bacterium]|nr:glycosyltransferase [Isosphaeraceae bacterium]